MKILVIGSPGAGKSTLSKALGRQLDIPVVHLDAHFWQPGWVMSERSVFDDFLKKTMAKDKWIMDGHYSRTLPDRIKEADQVIYIDMPLHTRLYRVVKRRFQYKNKTRPDMNSGCPEKLDWDLISFVLSFRKKNHETTMDLARKVDQVTFIHLKGKKAVRSYISSLSIKSTTSV